MNELVSNEILFPYQTTMRRLYSVNKRINQLQSQKMIQEYINLEQEKELLYKKLALLEQILQEQDKSNAKTR